MVPGPCYTDTSLSLCLGEIATALISRYSSTVTRIKGMAATAGTRWTWRPMIVIFSLLLTTDLPFLLANGRKPDTVRPDCNEADFSHDCTFISGGKASQKRRGKQYIHHPTEHGVQSTHQTMRQIEQATHQTMRQIEESIRQPKGRHSQSAHWPMGHVEQSIHHAMTKGSAHHPKSCYNNGTCRHVKNTTRCVCHCPPTYTGQVCETKINVCFSTPCHHGGTCAQTNDTYWCICTTHYKGEQCSEKISSSWLSNKAVLPVLISAGLILLCLIIMVCVRLLKCYQSQLPSSNPHFRLLTEALDANEDIL